MSDGDQEEAAERFWASWWDADELDQLEILEQLPNVGTGIFKTNATLLNGYLTDLRMYARKRPDG